MTPEEYEKFKEAEKQHLRKLKELKKEHRQLSRKAKVTKAVTDMAEGVQSLYDEHEEMVDRLERGAVGSEARLDVALDSLGASDATRETLDASQLEEDQKAIQKANAQELIRQMKLADGIPEEKPAPGAKSVSEANADASETKAEETPSDLPEKTIGRMRP